MNTKSLLFLSGVGVLGYTWWLSQQDLPRVSALEVQKDLARKKEEAARLRLSLCADLADEQLEANVDKRWWQRSQYTQPSIMAGTISHEAMLSRNLLPHPCRGGNEAIDQIIDARVQAAELEDPEKVRAAKIAEARDAGPLSFLSGTIEPLAWDAAGHATRIQEAELVSHYVRQLKGEHEEERKKKLFGLLVLGGALVGAGFLLPQK